MSDHSKRVTNMNTNATYLLCLIVLYGAAVCWRPFEHGLSRDWISARFLVDTQNALLAALRPAIKRCLYQSVRVLLGLF